MAAIRAERARETSVNIYIIMALLSCERTSQKRFR